MTPEGEVKREIKEGLEAMGIYPYSELKLDRIGGYFMPVQTGFGKRAVDFIGDIRGRLFAIEAKRAEGGKLSSLQRKFLQSVVDTGGIGIVARCWEDVRERLP